MVVAHPLVTAGGAAHPGATFHGYAAISLSYFASHLDALAHDRKRATYNHNARCQHGFTHHNAIEQTGNRL